MRSLNLLIIWIITAIHFCNSFAMSQEELYHGIVGAAFFRNDTDAVTKYMESYEDVNRIIDNHSVTHHCLTVSIEILDLMLKYKADINIKATCGHTLFNMHCDQLH